MMPEIHVSSLARLHETVTRTNASHVVTLINAATVVERPAVITPDRHLFIGVSDITAPIDGHIMPSEAHVHTLLDFVQQWDRMHPIVIHCWAGISRSTATRSPRSRRTDASTTRLANAWDRFSAVACSWISSGTTKRPARMFGRPP
jgi:predicted protein tyrosine phosphatase